MNKIDLKDLVKPKFQIGDTVYIRNDGQSSGTPRNVRCAVVTAWRYVIESKARGVSRRLEDAATSESIVYYVDGRNGDVPGNGCYEMDMFHTPNEAFGLTAGAE